MSDCSRHAFDVPQTKRLRLLEPQGNPDVIECDGVEYVPKRTCEMNPNPDYDFVACSVCGYEEEKLLLFPCDGRLQEYDGNFCPNCGAQVIGERKEGE